jgi:hypothetical protein
LNLYVDKLPSFNLAQPESLSHLKEAAREVAIESLPPRLKPSLEIKDLKLVFYDPEY